ncbi:MAG TPA: IclR family transcriptional regulator [Paenirhodobacter sp.]
MTIAFQTAENRADTSGTQCLQRSFAVMRFLAGGASEGEKLVDIAGALDLSHPTAHRILKALESEGIVERPAGSRRYRLGAEAAWLGVAAYNRCPITRIAAATLDRLVGQVGDSVFLAVPSHLDAVYADRRLGSYAVQAGRVGIGARRPLGGNVAGQTLLAFMSQQRVEQILGDNDSRYRDWGFSADIVQRRAATARAQGYLCADSRINPERRVLSVPVRDVVGRPIAAISVLAARPRLGTERVGRLVPLLAEAAREIGAAVQHRAQMAS